MNIAEYTLPSFHAACMLSVKIIIASSVVLPGRPLKWFAGRSSCVSVRYDIVSAIILSRTLPMVLLSAIGLYAFGFV